MANELRLIYDAARTVTARVINPSTGDSLGTAPLTESGTVAGYYEGDLPEGAADVRPLDVMYLDGATVIGSETLEQAGALSSDQAELLESIATKVATLGAAGLEVVSPISAAGDITLIRGCDYAAQDGQAVTFTRSTWVSLDGATLTLTATSTETGETFELTGTVTQGDGGSQTITFEPLADITIDLEPGEEQYSFVVDAVLESGRRIRLLTGSITVT